MPSTCSFKSALTDCHIGSSRNSTPSRRANLAAGTKSLSPVTRIGVSTVFLDMAEPNREFAFASELSKQRLTKNRGFRLAELDASIEDRVMINAIVGARVVIKEPIDVIQPVTALITALGFTYTTRFRYPPRASLGDGLGQVTPGRMSALARRPGYLRVRPSLLWIAGVPSQHGRPSALWIQ